MSSADKREFSARGDASPISGDRPIEDASEDKLGFGALATRLGSALIDQASADGLVVGMEGKWGSGKSSLLNLTVKALRQLPTEVRPVVVEFKPWLIGDRDALIGSFFAQLAKEIESVEDGSGYSPLANIRQRRYLAERLRGYAAKAEVFGAILSAIPAAGWAGGLIKQIAAAAKKGNSAVPILQLKKELDASLAKLPRRIVVTIDDVDRLEPREVVELLRLVRSVADFKNVIYLLCYDDEILAESIRSATQVSDGHAYLEKIVQVGVSVPIPEPFHLRRWFESELSKFLVDLPEEALPRLRSVIDMEGGRRLSTPRQVVRALNSLHLMVPALGTEVDFPDLVWLQLLKGGNHKLYRWIEEYSSSAAAASSWRVNVSEDAQRKTFDELTSILEDDGLTFEAVRYALAEHLPGIATVTFPADKDKVPIYRSVDRNALEKAIEEMRLASPDHYRLYFALAQPSMAPRVEDFRRLLDAASGSVGDVSTVFRHWIASSDPAVGTKADVMLNRIQQRWGKGLSPEQCERILLALSDIMDEAASLYPSDEFGTPAVWREAERTVPTLLHGIGKRRRREVVVAAFQNGRALGWLTSLFRHETFSHGRFGKNREDESNWLLSDSELDEVAEAMTSRYRSMEADDFFTMSNGLSALFAWAQAGDPEGPRQLIGHATETDSGLLKGLEKLTNVVRSNGGDFIILRRENIDPFIEYDKARARIEALASGSDPAFQARATRLLEQFKAAESF